MGIIAVGTLFANRTTPLIDRETAHSGKILLEVAFYSSLVSAGFWIWRMKGFRWLGVSLMMIVEVVIFGAMFIAGMSVSGDWL